MFSRADGVNFTTAKLKIQLLAVERAEPFVLMRRGRTSDGMSQTVAWNPREKKNSKTKSMAEAARP